MKRFIALFISVALLFCFTACNTSQPEETAASVEASAGLEEAKAAIKSGDYEKAYTLLLNIEGEEAEKLRSNFIFMPVSYTYDDSTTTYTYDKNGRILTENDSFGEGSYCNVSYTYDDDGKITNYHIDEFFNADNNDFCNVNYTYDEKGNLISKENTGNFLIELSGPANVYTYNIWKKVSYTYDENNNLITAEYDYGDANPTGSSEITKIVYTYDENNNLIAQADDYKKHTYTYNEQGKTAIEQVTYYSDGSGHTITYTYDSDGVLTTKEKTSSSGNKTISTYDKNGNQLTEKHIYPDGRWYDYTYTYTDAGDLLTKTENDIDNEWEKYVLNYDSNGNMIKADLSDYENNTGSLNYTYDQHGNVLTRSINSEQDSEIEWKLFYFPDGINERAEEILTMFKYYYHIYIYG